MHNVFLMIDGLYNFINLTEVNKQRVCKDLIDRIASKRVTDVHLRVVLVAAKTMIRIVGNKICIKHIGRKNKWAS